MSDKLEQLLKMAHDLQEEIKRINDAKGSKDGVVQGDAIHRDELEKMKADMIAEIEKARVIPSAAPAGADQVPTAKDFKGFGDFLLKAKYKDPSVLKTVMSEGTPAQGGYTVPEEWSSEIIGILNEAATIVPKCTPMTQNSVTKNLPKWLTDLSITWTGEATAKTQTKPTLTTLTSTLRKMAAIVTFTDEYLSDDISGITNQVSRLIGENMAYELERVIITGDVSGLGDPFNGILYSAGINTTNQGGANLQYSDLVACWNNTSVIEPYRNGAEWIMNRTALGLVMGMVDGNGRPLWNLQSINGRMVNTLFGDVINISNTLLNTYTLGDSTGTAIIYGNPKHVVVGSKTGNTGINVDVSNSAILSSSTSVSENLWQQDETGYRFVMRKSVVVAIAAAFSVLQDVR